MGVVLEPRNEPILTSRGPKSSKTFWLNILDKFSLLLEFTIVWLIYFGNYGLFQKALTWPAYVLKLKTELAPSRGPMVLFRFFLLLGPVQAKYGLSKIFHMFLVATNIVYVVLL